MDESGCDKWIGFRRTGSSPCNIMPSQVTKFHRDQRYQIFKAYSQDGVILFRVYQGSTDSITLYARLGLLTEHCFVYAVCLHQLLCTYPISFCLHITIQPDYPLYSPEQEGSQAPIPHPSHLQDFNLESLQSL